MDYLFNLAAIGAAVGLGIYLIRQHWQDNARDDLQRRVFSPTPGRREAQAAVFQRGGHVEESDAVSVDFERYRVSQFIPAMKFLHQRIYI